jgi:hypothetical protein
VVEKEKDAHKLQQEHACVPSRKRYARLRNNPQRKREREREREIFTECGDNLSVAAATTRLVC